MKLKIGIFGISRTGKSTLASALSENGNVFQFYNLSDIIDEIVPGGLSQFKLALYSERKRIRADAISILNNQHRAQNKHTLVTSHYCFIGTNSYDIMWTTADADFYDVIFFLRRPAHDILEQLKADKHHHSKYSLVELEQWQEAEFNGLTVCCSEGNIKLIELESQEALDELMKKVLQAISDLV